MVLHVGWKEDGREGMVSRDVLVSCNVRPLALFDSLEERELKKNAERG